MLLFSLDYLATAFVYHKAIIFFKQNDSSWMIIFFFSFWCCFVCRYLDFFQASLLGIIFLMEISILKITLEMYSFFYLNLFFLRDIMLFRNGDIEDCLLFWHFSQCPGLFILTTVFSGGNPMWYIMDFLLCINAFKRNNLKHIYRNRNVSPFSFKNQ